MRCDRRAAALAAAASLLSFAPVASARSQVHQAAGKPASTPRRTTDATYLSSGFAPGERVPDVAFVDLKGSKGTLSHVGGSVGAVLVVRDAECPVSQRYSPRMAELERQYVGKGYQFYYVDVTPYSRAAALADAAKYRLAGRTILDSDKRIVNALRAGTTAEAYVLDARGTIRYRGAIDDQYGITFHRDRPTHTYLRDALDAVARGDEPPLRQTSVSGCILPTDREAPGVPSPVTYNNRISRIIQNNCQSCHRPDGMAPMPLVTYRQVYERRLTLQYMISRGLMPPWTANNDVGEWANDRSLPARDAEDFQRWLAAGAPEGRPQDAPLPRKWTNGWNIGTPDTVLSIPDRFRIPAQGVVEYKYSYLKTNFSEDKWITAIEVRPTAGKATHHVLVFLEDPSVGNYTRWWRRGTAAEQQRSRGQQGADGFFAVTTLGYPGIAFAEGTGKRLPKGAWLKFQIHYQPNGVEQIDQTQIAFRFADHPLREVQSKAAFATSFAIPPNDPHYKVEATYKFTQPGTLTSLFPHMHLRGGAFRYDLRYPDGKTVELLDVTHFSFNWQMYYELKTPIEIPAGATLIATAWYDNSRNNPFNPDPSKTVRFGQQTYEEMMGGYFDFIAAPVGAAAKAGGR